MMFNINRFLVLSLSILMLIECSSSKAATNKSSLLDIDLIYKLLVDDHKNNPLLFADKSVAVAVAEPSEVQDNTCELSCPAGCKLKLYLSKSIQLFLYRI